MAKCKFTGTDPLHFKTYDCTAAAKTDDGYCKRHEFSLNRTLDLIKRVGELEAQNKRSKQNTDHWQHEVGKLHAQIDRLKAQHTTLITELREMAEEWPVVSRRWTQEECATAIWCAAQLRTVIGERSKEVEAQVRKYTTFITKLRMMAKDWIANRLPPDDPAYLVGEFMAKSSCAYDLTALLDKEQSDE